MKQITIVLIFTLWQISLYSQEKYSYYIIGVDEKVLVPLSTSTLPDSTLSVQFLDNNLQNFFANKKVYGYKRAFPTATTAFLQHVYKVTLDEITYLNDLFALNVVQHAELLGENKLTHMPNDYNYYGTPQSPLELINAQEAWDITTGDPNVLIGITDTYFETTHEDLVNQIIQNFDYNTNPSNLDYHGVLVAGLVAAETNNNKGISGIGYNCKNAYRTLYQ